MAACRRPGVQAKARADPLENGRFDDGRDDLELTIAVRAVLHIDLKDPLEQPGQADARLPSCADLVVAASSSPQPRERLGAMPETRPWPASGTGRSELSLHVLKAIARCNGGGLERQLTGAAGNSRSRPNVPGAYLPRSLQPFQGIALRALHGRTVCELEVSRPAFVQLSCCLVPAILL